MGVVAPISGTGATLVPVVVGLATGERPSLLACVGIAVAFPAVFLIPRTDPKHDPAAGEGEPSPKGTLYGVIAGLGFGAQLALVGQIGGGAGLLPLVVLWLGSATTVVALAIAMREPWRPRRRGLLPVLLVGLLSAAALVFYLLATRQGLLAIVSVIAALYPAATVAMAALVLHERIGRLQAVGLGLAIVAVVLVAGG